jgi:palmitoyl-[glycerolipid] 3-(E)-desaturase
MNILLKLCIIVSATVSAFQHLPIQHRSQLTSASASHSRLSAISSSPSKLSADILERNISISDEEKEVRKAKGSSPEFAIEGDSTEETLSQRLTLISHFILVSVNLALSISMFPPVSLISISQLVLTIAASIIVGDFATGVFHWAVDNYGSIHTPIFGTVCAAFQGHHVTPWTITFRPFANNLYKIAFATIPALFLLALASTSVYTRLFFTLFINWWLLSQEFHKYSHMRQVPFPMKILQDSNLILSKKVHGLHHTAPFEGNYCILTGICNPILDKSNFFRYLEKYVYRCTGNKPNTWKEDPMVEKLAMSL